MEMVAEAVGNEVVPDGGDDTMFMFTHGGDTDSAGSGCVM